MSDSEAMLGLTLDQESRIFPIDNNGMPMKRKSVKFRLEKPTIIMINGFDFDPTEEGEDNPHQTLFKETWRPNLQKLEMVGNGSWDVFGFGWYSAELEFSSWLGALTHGRYNPYRWGWDLARRASSKLAHLIGWDEGLENEAENGNRQLPDVYLIAHSLGTRVALNALLQLQPQRVSRVLILNGAEYSQTAKTVAHYTEADVLNVKVQTDDVLDVLGENFAPDEFMADVVGRQGIRNPPDNWAEIQLDDPKLRDHGKSAFNWDDLSGDNPDRYADHWYSYNHTPNWELFRSFLSGEFTAKQLSAALSTGTKLS